MPTYTREQLKNYSLRALGAPVVQINVAEEQLEDRLEEAIEYFRLYHYDGIERMYFKHQLTQDNFDTKTIDVPDLVYGVRRVIPFRQGSSSANLFDVQYQLRLNDLYELTNTSMVYYSMVMQHMAMLDQMLNGYPQYEFNRLSGKLHLEINRHKLRVGEWLVVEAYRALDPEVSVKMYNDPWLKQYVIALFKSQWGTNLKKFGGLQLPGGVTLDGKDLYLEAQSEIKELEDELMNKAAPLTFFMG